MSTMAQWPREFGSVTKSPQIASNRRGEREVECRIYYAIRPKNRAHTRHTHTHTPLCETRYSG